MKKNKKFEVIEESRFLSSSELNIIKGGTNNNCPEQLYFTCGVGKKYNVCTEGIGKTVCSLKFNVRPCFALTTCDNYIECATINLITCEPSGNSYNNCPNHA